MRSLANEAAQRPIFKSIPILLTCGVLAACSSEASRFGTTGYNGTTNNQKQIIGNAQTYPSAPQVYVPQAPQVQMPQAPEVVITNPVTPTTGYTNQATKTDRLLTTSSIGTPVTNGRYIVSQPGDTLYSTSRRYGVSVNDLMRVNGIHNPSSLKVGQRLVIPGAQPVAVAQPAMPVVKAPQYYATPASAPIPVNSAPLYTSSIGSTAPSSATHVIGHGDTLYSLARRYGVSVSQLMATNRISDPTRISLGQRLVIPSAGASGVAPKVIDRVVQPAYNAPQRNTQPVSLAPTQQQSYKPTFRQQTAQLPAGTVVHTPAIDNVVTGSTARSTAPSTLARGYHVVRSGDTLYSISRRYGVAASSISAANGIGANNVVKLGQKLLIPANGQTAAVRPAPQPTPVAQQPLAQQKVVAVRSQPVSTPAPAAVVQTPIAQPTTPVIANGPSFRWPVKGRIISKFGLKANGERNDGVDLEVPAGVDVRAAETGKVIYAGDELKGYGNLVLVRHSDGWVSAYANNSQLLVNRGDEVQRGQIIARSGATGNVSRPQLHFELRKGSKPVDPLPYMTGA